MWIQTPADYLDKNYDAIYAGTYGVPYHAQTIREEDERLLLELKAEHYRPKTPEVVEETIEEPKEETVEEEVETVYTQSYTVSASFYVSMCVEGCTGITAVGYDVRNTIHSPEGYRIIAVDPNVIPLGTVVQVDLEDGDSFVAIAGDTGGGIDGYEIDVLVGSTSEAIRRGRQTATITIL